MQGNGILPARHVIHEGPTTHEVGKLEGHTDLEGDTSPELDAGRRRERAIRSQCIPLNKSLRRLDRAEKFWNERQWLLAEAFN